MNELKNISLEFGSGIWFDAQDAYEEIKQNYNPQLEIIISQSPYWAYNYAKYILKAPFPLGEPAIAKSYKLLEYAQNVLNSRFKLAESKIQHHHNYTKHILKFNHE